jgi:hypothetical protein
MLLALCGLLAASLLAAGAFTTWKWSENRRAMNATLLPPTQHGAIVVSVPKGWELSLSQRRDTQRLTLDEPGGHRRTLSITSLRVPPGTSPVGLLGQIGVVPRGQLASRKFQNHGLRWIGLPNGQGVILQLSAEALARLFETGVGQQTIACIVYADGHAAVIDLTNQGAQRSPDLLLVTDIAKSLKLTDAPANRPPDTDGLPNEGQAI